MARFGLAFREGRVEPVAWAAPGFATRLHLGLPEETLELLDRLAWRGDRHGRRGLLRQEGSRLAAIGLAAIGLAHAGLGDPWLAGSLDTVRQEPKTQAKIELLRPVYRLARTRWPRQGKHPP